MEKKELLESIMVESLGLFKALFGFSLKKVPKSIDEHNIMATIKIRLDKINRLYKEVEEVFPW